MAEADEQTRLIGASGSYESSTSFNEDDHPEHWTFSRKLALFLSKYSWYHPIGGAGEEVGGSSYSMRDEISEKGEAAASAAAEADEETFFDTCSSEQEQQKLLNPYHPTADPRQMLKEAWGYWEHVTLPRYFAFSRSKQNLEKAKPGESALATRLYGVWETRETDLSEFGIGVGLYFYTLRCLAVIFLIAGLINIPSMMYYASLDYNDDARGGLDWILRGSAICTDERWAPCPTCRWHDWDYFPYKYDRYAQTLQIRKTTERLIREESLHFIKVNSCSFGYTLGFYALVSVVFLAVPLYVLCFIMLRKQEIILDEAAQTAQDYSVRVDNPPPDASDPEEWKAFFDQFGQKDDGNDAIQEKHVITCCTVALGNEVLVRALVERRQYLIQLESLMKPGATFNKHNLDHAVENSLAKDDSSWWQKILFGSGSASDIRQKIRSLDEEIEELTKQTYKVTSVFVCFESEHAQRAALSALSVSSLAPLRHKWGSPVLPKHLLFRGEHLLKVVEAPEPTAVRWHQLDTTFAVSN
jgi:hypothetical protein